MTVTVAPEIVYGFMLVLARLAAMLMLMPAIGEASIPGRIRVGLAVGLAIILYPVARPDIVVPETIGAMALGLGFEIAIGVFVGSIARLLLSAVQVAGAVIAYQSGLASAQSIDPTQGITSALVATFLSVVAVALIFTFDLHHLLIRAIADSYTLFRPGGGLPTGDFAALAVKVVAESFLVAIQLAAPFLVFGLVFYVGLGILSRLMPQVQIFFVAMPANILLGFIILMLLMGSIGLVFADYFARALAPVLK